MPWSMRVLRAFLGVTFAYAGMQKLLDPGFLHAGSATYIGTQLESFGRGTPAAPLMHLLASMPVLTGIGVALIEIAVGIATLLGVGLVAAAFVGLSVSVVLWLSATWHVHPYFLGSDSIYAVAWLSLLLGAWGTVRRRSPAHAHPISARVDVMDRRAVLRAGMVGGAAILLAGAAKALAGPFVQGSSGATAAARTVHQGASAGPRSPSPTGSPTVQGRTIATLDQLPIGKAIGFTDPVVGPAALVRLADGSVVAYSRICTHAGCEVGYDPSARLLVCPCHGAEFDPAQRAQPVAGPTSTPLQYIRVAVDRSTGNVVLPG